MGNKTQAQDPFPSYFYLIFIEEDVICFCEGVKITAFSIKKLVSQIIFFFIAVTFLCSSLWGVFKAVWKINCLFFIKALPLRAVLKANFIRLISVKQVMLLLAKLVPFVMTTNVFILLTDD